MLVLVLGGGGKTDLNAQWKGGFEPFSIKSRCGSITSLIILYLIQFVNLSN